MRSDASPPASGARCPHCGASLRDNLRHERLAAAGGEPGAPPVIASILYCGSCGATLSLTHAGAPQRVPPSLEVADPADADSPEGRFQLRCRELIAEIQQVGFQPGGWIGLINQLGAAAAARKLLQDRRVLPVTRWLVARGRPELTMEHEIGEARWVALFSEEERAEAARRLSDPSGGGFPPIPS